MYPKFVKGEQEQANFAALLAAKGLLIPYVGAGFSYAADGGCPSWGGFLWQLFEQYKGDMVTGEDEKFTDYYQQGQYEQALQCLIDTIKVPQFQTIIEQTFNKPIDDHFPPGFKRKFSLFHQAFTGPWLTTNMDRFIEASLPNKAHQLTTVAGFKDPRLVSDLNRSDLKGYLFKLHGDAKDTNSLVFAHHDYVAAYGDEVGFNFDQPLPQAFKQLFCNHSLLFIGCSLTIDRPLMILSHLANNQGVKDQFALLKRSDFFGDDKNSSKDTDKLKTARANLRDMKIIPIWFDDFDDIDVVLEYLAPSTIDQREDFDDTPEPDIFVGRQAQLTTLLEHINQAGSLFAITDSQLHHLVGQGGVGKTTLGRQVLSLCQQQFPDGCFEIRIDNMTPISFAKILAQRLKLPDVKEPDNEQQARDNIKQMLNQKRLLLLLDNVDSGEVLKDLLPAQFQSCVMVTSRDTELSDLIRLSYPKVTLQALTLEQFTDTEALELFKYMLEDKFDGQLTATYLAIANQLAHLPIALRLSISTMLFGDKLSADELLHQLNNNQQLKIDQQATAFAVNAKERSLLAVFDLSAPLLTDELKYVLALIAVCEQGPVPEDFLRVLNENYTKGIDHELLKKHLRTLARYHWCKRKTFDGEDHFELHQIVRQVVTSQLLQSAYVNDELSEQPETQLEEDPTEADLEKCFAHLLYHCFIYKPLDFRVLDRFVGQTDKAFLWFKTHQPQMLGYWVSEVFCQYCRNRGHGERFIRFCQWLREASTDEEAIAIALGHQALILKDRGKLDAAFKLQQQKLEIEESRGNQQGIATCYLNQAVILQLQQEFTKALALLKRSEQIFDELGDKKNLSTCYGNQASVFNRQGQLDEAMVLYKKQERLCKAIDNQLGLSRCYGDQAIILTKKGKLAEALELYKKQLQICQKLGNQPELAQGLWNMANIFIKRKDFNQAIALREQAIGLWQSCQLPTDKQQQQLNHLKQLVKIKAILKPVALLKPVAIGLLLCACLVVLASLINLN